jgi:sugar lactone lactonase YvrE
MQLTSLRNPICHLAECPIWNVSERALYWTDILEKRIWRYDPKSSEISIEWQGDFMAGGFAFTKNNDIVMCTDKGVYLLSRAQRERSLHLIFDIPMASNERFNDITTDPAGRIFAGTMTTDRKKGKLYRLQNNTEPKIVLDGLSTSNGMTFSMDEKYFYHTDSSPMSIKKYEYDAGSGQIHDPQLFYQGTEEYGHPDGITVDVEDHIWVACWRASKVIRLDPSGRIAREIPTPALQTSSIVFAGENMNELYITTACEGGADLQKGLDKNGNFLGGLIYHTSLDVSGRKEFPADF